MAQVRWGGWLLAQFAQNTGEMCAVRRAELVEDPVGLGAAG